MLLIESNYDTQVIVEGEGPKKNIFIEGIFMQVDIINRNGRDYPDKVLGPEINTYIEKYVKTNRALGEMEHPDTAKINLREVSHLIKEIRKEGKNYIGKAQLLEGTPMGDLACGLVKNGVQLGVSSRGHGSVKEDSRGVCVVQPDFKLVTVDIVYQPSAPDAFVQGLMEGEKFVWGSIYEDTEFVERLKTQVSKTRAPDLNRAKIEAFRAFVKKFKSH